MMRTLMAAFVLAASGVGAAASPPVLCSEGNYLGGSSGGH